MCFTERELEIIMLVARGLTNQEIAERLYLSEHTVRKYHMTNILGKLALTSRMQVALWAIRSGHATPQVERWT